jgi:hypothetical protein
MNWTYTLGTGLLDPWTLGATALIPAPRHPATALPALLPAGSHHLRRRPRRLPPDAPRAVSRPAPPPPRLSAGEALPDATRAAWEAATGTKLHEALGMTEISTYLSGAPGRPAPPGTTGYVQPGRLIALLDDDGHPSRAAPKGELAVSTADPGLMRGYLGEAPPQGPWFRTGDMGPDGPTARHPSLAAATTF